MIQDKSDSEGFDSSALRFGRSVGALEVRNSFHNLALLPEAPIRALRAALWSVRRLSVSVGRLWVSVDNQIHGLIFYRVCFSGLALLPGSPMAPSASALRRFSRLSKVVDWRTDCPSIYALLSDLEFRV